LPLERAGEVSDQVPERVAHFELKRGSVENWIVKAPQSSARNIPPEEALSQKARAEGLKPKPVSAIYLTGEGPKSVAVPCDLNAGDFNQVLVNVRNFGRGAEFLRVVLRSGGNDLAKSPWTEFKARGGLRPFSAEFTTLRFVEGKIDEVVIEMQGRSNAIAVTFFDLIATPLGNFLPAVEGLGSIVALGEDDRACVGLSTRNPLEARQVIPDGAELFYSFGTKSSLINPRGDAQLKVTVTAEGLPPLEEVHALPAKFTREWGEGRLDLTAFADKQSLIRFELQSTADLEQFCLVGEAAVSRRSAGAPTVLLVTSDTHRADHMGQADPENVTDLVRTPHLDALGDRGIYFTQAYSSTNVTNPSHVALMTGTSPRDTRILNNATFLAEQAPTLAESFQAGGYRTMAILSAYHLLNKESGLGQGFDRVNGPRNGDRDGEDSVDVLEEWVADAAGQPLFIWLHLFDAHSPYGAPAPHDQTYWEAAPPFDKDAEPIMPAPLVPAFLTGLTDKDYPYQQYRGEVDYVDVQMGRVLGLERMASAVIAFTADHGESFGEHGVWWDHADLYPQTVHIPLILSWPGGPTGVRNSEFVRQIDLGRTLLDLAELGLEEFPGRNLDWALEEFPASDALFELSAHGYVACIQTPSWRLSVHLRNHHEAALEKARLKHEVEFYDLKSDPLCLNDLVKDPAHFERAKQMRSKLMDWLDAADPVGWGESRDMTQKQLNDLRGIGYGGETGALPAGSLYREDPANEWCAFFAR